MDMRSYDPRIQTLHSILTLVNAGTLRIIVQTWYRPVSLDDKSRDESIAMLSRDFDRFIVFKSSKMLIIETLAPFLTLTTGQY